MLGQKNSCIRFFNDCQSLALGMFHAQVDKHDQWEAKKEKSRLFFFPHV